MNEVKIPGILSPETIEELNANKDLIKFILEPQDGEIVCEGGKCCIKDCSKIDRLKFVLCDVKIDVKNSECDNNNLEEEVRKLKRLLYIKRMQIREIREQEHEDKEELSYLIRIFVYKSREIRNIYWSLKAHEHVIIDLEARIEESRKMLKHLPERCWEELSPTIEHDMRQFKKELYNEHLIIERIKSTLKEKLESRKRVEKAINGKTEGVFAELLYI